MNYCVVTTINYPTHAIKELFKEFQEQLIIVADKKTPPDWEHQGLMPISVTPETVYAPENHYARKNAGYIEAIKRGAESIYDTDDDNIPSAIWMPREVNCFGFEVEDKGWCNIYCFFTKRKVWARGFPLEEIKNIKKYLLPVFTNKDSSIQQGLADVSPDVDAVFRLTDKEEFFFEETRSIWLGKNTWSPFNSQSTWWFPKAYPLMYLPVTAPFRMTDIWRGFVAQRCLWEIGEGVTFHSPSEVYQIRNEHNLLKDFEDEIEGYLKNGLIVKTLESLELMQGTENMCDNMIKCYQALIENKYINPTELFTLKEWLNEIKKIWKH